MYLLKVATQKTTYSNYDYVLKDIAAFYDIAKTIYKPLNSIYSIAVKNCTATQALDFVKSSDSYDYLDVTLYLPQDAMDYLTLRRNDLNVEKIKSPWSVFLAELEENRVYINKKLVHKLYNSIPKTTDGIASCIAVLVREFGEQQTPITESQLAKHFILIDLVYPKQVMLAYLRMDRYRENKLAKSIEQLGPEVVLHAIIKNLKLMMKLKAEYFTTGVASKEVKSVDTRNLEIMYRIFNDRGKTFFGDFHGIESPEVLLKLYEKGVAPNDLLLKRTSSKNEDGQFNYPTFEG